MASTTFVDRVTVIPTDWLNEVNGVVWTLLNGATSAATARTQLGLGTISTQNANNVSISGGSVTGVTLSSSNATITGGSIASITSLGVSGAITSTSSVTATDVITPSLNGGQLSGFRNMIINGGFSIDQRNEGAEVTNGVGGIYGVDRWTYAGAAASKFKGKRVTVGVASNQARQQYSLRFTSLSAYSASASDYFYARYVVEGPECRRLFWGNSTYAQPITISFWAYHSQTGTYNVAVQNAAGTRCYVATYTVSSAFTYEYKEITITAPSTGAVYNYDPGEAGIYIIFDLGSGTDWETTANTWGTSAKFRTSGAVGLVATNAATMDILGLQVEVGSKATAFEHRPYHIEKQLCQRYYQKSFPETVVPAQNAGVGGAYIFPQSVGASTAAISPAIVFPVPMRTTPTITLYNPSAANANIRNSTGGTDWSGSTSTATATTLYFSGTSPGGSAAGNVSSIHWAATAEF